MMCTSRTPGKPAVRSIASGRRGAEHYQVVHTNYIRVADGKLQQYQADA